MAKYVGTSSSDVNLLDGNWHHIAGVRKGDNLHYYVDGVLRDTQPGANFDVSTSSILTWAWTSNNSPSVKYAGTLDETQISNTAHSASWISAAYAAMTDSFIHYSDDKTSRSIIDITLNNDTQNISDGRLRMSGTIYSSDIEFLPSQVQFQINGGGWNNATITDGIYDEQTEEYYLDFSSRDSNFEGEGYTVGIRAIRGSEVEIDNLLYFQPFTQLGPADSEIFEKRQPQFSFHVNKDRYTDLTSKLARFQIEINKNDTGWYTYIDGIPVHNSNATIETDTMQVTYSNPRGDINVLAKGFTKALEEGTYKWRVIAIDQRGHRQETGVRRFTIGNPYIGSIRTDTSLFLPLAILSITGAIDLHISTTYLEGIKERYFTNSANPVLYGIAPRGALVEFEFIEEDCQNQSMDLCRKYFKTVANNDSRWGINTKGLRLKQEYKVNGTVFFEGHSNKLPTFTLFVSLPR